MNRRLRLLPSALLAAAILLAGCQSDDTSSVSGRELAERWVRLGEDPRAEVLVYDRALPPGLSELLNPGVGDEVAEEDRLTVPVHPQGELRGSYLIRRTDGSNVIWLIFDVPEGSPVEVTETIGRQLDESPWQVTGGQASAIYTVMTFQPTVSGDINGTAVVQVIPADGTFEVTVDRDGREVALSVPRGSVMPILDADLRDDLTVRATRPGLAATAGLRADDRIVAVSGVAVASLGELEAALVALGDGGGAAVSVMYLLQITPPVVVAAPEFVPPIGLTLPATFPVRDAFEGMTVVNYTWVREPAGSAYIATLLTTESTSVVADALRGDLEAAGWTITGDAPLGFATQIDFAHAGDRLRGTAQVDLFPEDERYTGVWIEILTDATAGN